MIRYAPFLLIAFLAVLTYAGWARSKRSVTRKQDLARSRAMVKDLQQLVFDIKKIAVQNQDIDPGCGLILLAIHDYETKELNQ